MLPPSLCVLCSLEKLTPVTYHQTRNRTLHVPNKVVCAVILLVKEGTFKKLFQQWSLVGSLTAYALPAAIYAVQNSLLQISYKNLDSLTFSILNQTKLLFTAFFTFLILGQKQSGKQILALGLLIIAATLLSVGESTNKSSSGANSENILLYGIVPVMVASVLSGLASSLCQWASQVKKHTSYLMTVEMSLIGSFCLLASMTHSPDGEAIKKYGFFHGWTLLTLVPVISNAVGGILVGLVTAYAGGVRKGFVIVSALLVTALFQFIFDGKPPSIYCLLALPLVTSTTLPQPHEGASGVPMAISQGLRADFTESNGGRNFRALLNVQSENEVATCLGADDDWFGEERQNNQPF